MHSEMVQLLGEFLGTFILILLGNGVVSGVVLNKTKATGAGWVAITLGWGFAVMMGVYVSGFMSPAHLNPAVTIAMAMIGSFSLSLVFPYIIAQMLGAMVASIILYLMFYPHYAETKNPADILGTFSTGPAIRQTSSNLISEIVGTAVLTTGILAFGQYAITQTSGVSPLLVGAIITAIGLSLGATTGYSLNPARDLGPRIMHAILPIKGKGDSDWSYAWIPVVGPIIGGSLGALLFNMVIQFASK
ncbi:MIP/aquaporin family protein [Lactococcus garvieae]|uniref:Glycerol uptake facilitator n=1 Tax=Lactococcus garvieae (strain Lg2) TaxID=420890 RepID=F9VD70_LACGL|nr:MIP/aquaporin family protein [Lactococcus garvieae]EOT32627.1 glycerol uptake facilitator protein [Lactococcus garvieae ATCC 49156]EOT93657.1 glycerol uptake facilitator protein [Lactococcus garvieae ATCC 49156]BAK58303.1 glycerol uptake facilitator [Lactococcus garvieae ATCC 49156]BAK60271.1 glycerol uptake facilitator [Lactococcus garvieae Lg2]BDW47210.1 aquaporin [Lactococcus garvieae]